MEKYNDNFEKLVLDTTVKTSNDGYTCFEDTIFYGEKGGMASDKGFINGQELLDLVYRDGEWWHKTAEEIKNPVHLEVDEETRYTNTSIQSLLHLLDGYYRKKGITIVAVGVKEGNQWYEIDTKEIEDNHLEQVQKYLDHVIREDVPVIFHYLDPADYPEENYRHLSTLRMVKFGEYDEQPCGTPHVNHTLQIGTAVILDSEKTSRGTKVYLSCNNSTKNLLVNYYRQMKELCVLLSCKKEEVLEKIKTIQSNGKQLSKENEQLKAQLRDYLVRELSESEESVHILYDKTSKDLGMIANQLVSLKQKNFFKSRIFLVISIY